MDREKVIKGLEQFRNDLKPFCGNHADWERFDAGLSLLKEQEAVKPVLDEQTGRIWLCGNCGSYVGFEDNDSHDPNEYDKYCRDCGTPVLWEGR